MALGRRNHSGHDVKLNVGFLLLLVVLIVAGPYFIAVALALTLADLVYGEDDDNCGGED